MRAGKKHGRLWTLEAVAVSGQLAVHENAMRQRAAPRPLGNRFHAGDEDISLPPHRPTLSFSGARASKQPPQHRRDWWHSHEIVSLNRLLAACPISIPVRHRMYRDTLTVFTWLRAGRRYPNLQPVSTHHRRTAPGATNQPFDRDKLDLADPAPLMRAERTF